MLKNTAKLSKNELTKVAGGTVKEFIEIMEAVGGNYKNLNRTSSALCNVVDMVDSAFGGINSKVIEAAVKPLEYALKNDLGINANIDVGMRGTGICQSSNKYSINGKNISHTEVLNMIKAA